MMKMKRILTTTMMTSRAVMRIMMMTTTIVTITGDRDNRNLNTVVGPGAGEEVLEDLTVAA
jgi:hypothetical protein